MSQEPIGMTGRVTRHHRCLIPYKLGKSLRQIFKMHGTLGCTIILCTFARIMSPSVQNESFMGGDYVSLSAASRQAAQQGPHALSVFFFHFFHIYALFLLHCLLLLHFLKYSNHAFEKC